MWLLAFVLTIVFPKRDSAKFGFDEKYECDESIFDTASRYDPGTLRIPQIVV